MQRMQISQIVILDKKKKKIVLDTGICFALYNAEVRSRGLCEGMELLEGQYEEILTEILVKRAKARVLYLLKDGDKTEYQLKEKLRKGFYPEEAIEEAVEYAKQWHYVDDYRYASCYAEQKSRTMGKKAIAYQLAQKGVPDDIRRDVLGECTDGELDALDMLLRKKNIDFSTITVKEKQKLYAHFMRKGFSYENIVKKINEFESTDYLT